MFSALPNDIARHITKIAIEERNKNVLDQIRNNVVQVMDFAATDECGFMETPLFDGSTKYLHITQFKKNEQLASRGMITLTITFWVNSEEFELTKHIYVTPAGEYEEENDYSLYVIDRQGKYGDIVAEVFGHIFTDGIVY